MHLILETKPTPEENIAFDQTLIERAETSTERGEQVEEVLRLWEMPIACVILGRSSRPETEVKLDHCQADGVPVLRRMSGGATVVAGPGCIMYSLLLSYDKRPAWRMLDVAHQEVMSRIREATQLTLDAFGVNETVQLQGTCDLTIRNHKFSGNALRCKRHWMLYHGTLMVSMPTHWLSRYLLEPPRQPDYRANRSHEDFARNLLPLGSTIDAKKFTITLQSNLAQAWECP
jgi:lipoate---protein ligase